MTILVEKRWLFPRMSPGSSGAAGVNLYFGMFVGLHLYLMSQLHVCWLFCWWWRNYSGLAWFTGEDHRVSQFKSSLKNFMETVLHWWIQRHTMDGGKKSISTINTVKMTTPSIRLQIWHLSMKVQACTQDGSIQNRRYLSESLALSEIEADV